MDSKFYENQAGFIQNRLHECDDKIAIRRIILVQSEELKSLLYVFLVDFEKASDGVNREKLSSDEALWCSRQTDKHYILVSHNV